MSAHVESVLREHEVRKHSLLFNRKKLGVFGGTFVRAAQRARDRIIVSYHGFLRPLLWLAVVLSKEGVFPGRRIAGWQSGSLRFLAGVDGLIRWPLLDLVNLGVDSSLLFELEVVETCLLVGSGVLSGLVDILHV